MQLRAVAHSNSRSTHRLRIVGNELDFSRYENLSRNWRLKLRQNSGNYAFRHFISRVFRQMRIIYNCTRNVDGLLIQSDRLPGVSVKGSLLVITFRIWDFGAFKLRSRELGG